MLGKLFGARPQGSQDGALFVASDEVRTRSDSVDRARALDALTMTPTRRVMMIATSTVSLAQGSLGGASPIGAPTNGWSQLDRFEGIKRP